MSTTQRPFKVLGIQQVAIGGTSKERLRQLWVDKLGLAVTGNFVSERENVDEDIWGENAGEFRPERWLEENGLPSAVREILDILQHILILILGGYLPISIEIYVC